MEKGESVFNRFDVVSDVSDHHFRSKESGFSNSKNYMHVMKEWKILEENLPDSIYVSVYETRIDLMRAVIVGAAGTPYHDGLFFFDIKLPSLYPNVPPIFYFHSFGHRLNPNLYDDGKVCLSLLNTWSGEKWDPQGSTLLQVLLSIQALVLNEKPYFNEPYLAMDTLSDTNRHERNSRDYSEKTFLLTWKVGNQLARRPPKNFEDVVSNHFRTRAATVLSACREYASGRVMVEYYCDEGQLSPSLTSSEAQVSKPFGERLTKELYPKLVQMFQSLEKKELEKSREKKGIFKKAVARMCLDGRVRIVVATAKLLLPSWLL